MIGYLYRSMIVDGLSLGFSDTNQAMILAAFSDTNLLYIDSICLLAFRYENAFSLSKTVLNPANISKNIIPSEYISASKLYLPFPLLYSGAI
jgi:hypothetical protein